MRSRIPLFGEIVCKTTLARVCRVLATLLQSGVTLVRALEVAIPVTDGAILARALEAARDSLAGGTAASLDEALSATGRFPQLLVGFVRVGASAGNVPQMLVKLAEYYEDDVESILVVLPVILQTGVTIGLGAVVGAIASVVYLPLSALGSSIR